MSQYEIVDKVLSITTDNASNMICAMSIFSVDNPTIVHIRCACHVINLIVQSALKEGEITNSIEKLRYFCKKIHSSSKLKEQLMQQTKLFDEKQVTVILDVETRWNSTHAMISRALDLKKTLTSLSSILVNNKESDFDGINEDDWKIAEKIILFLEPFNQGKFKN